MHKIKEKLLKELKKYEDANQLSGSSLEAVRLITDAIKNIDKIEMLENVDGQSYHEGSYRGGSYNYDDSYGRHYIRGHYSRDGGQDGGNYSETRYSRRDSKDHIREELERMRAETSDGNTKNILRRCIEDLE